MSTGTLSKYFPNSSIIVCKGAPNLLLVRAFQDPILSLNPVSEKKRRPLLLYDIWESSMSESSLSNGSFGIDNSRNEVSSSTFSLESQDTALLLAFLSLYTILAGRSLWRTIAFCLHQSRASNGADRSDGLFHQQQALLRNVETSLSATWQLLRLAFAWRRRVRNSFARSGKLLVFASAVLAAITAAVLLTSKIVDGDFMRAGYQNISIPGICIIVALDTLLMLSRTCVDTVIGSPRKLHHGQNGRLAWALDEKLQLQRMAYEGHGWGPFTKGASSVPVTERDVVLGAYDFDDPDRPTITKNTSIFNGTGFWVNRGGGEADVKPSTADSVSEKTMVAQTKAGAEARGRAFAWTAASNDGENRGSSIMVGGLGGARHLHIVNGGLDGSSSFTPTPLDSRRHSIAATGIANNPSLVSIISNISSKGLSSTGALTSRDSGFANNPSLVSVTSSLGPNGRISHLSTSARTSATSVLHEHAPDLRDLLQTDAGTAMVQQHTQHLLPPVQEQTLQSQAKEHRHSPLQYEHQKDRGGEYDHRAETYKDSEPKDLEPSRLDGIETGSCRIRKSGVSKE